MSKDVDKIKHKVSKVDVNRDKNLRDEIEQWEVESTKGGDLNKFQKKSEDNKWSLNHPVLKWVEITLITHNNLSYFTRIETDKNDRIYY